MIPKTISEVTPAWLSEVLGCEVRGMELEQIGLGIGLMGDIYRAQLDSDFEAASVVVKLPSQFEENRAQGVALGMFDAEIRFYREQAHRVTTGIPRLYHADIVPGTAEFVMLMEDLSHLQMVDQHIGMSFDQARSTVRVLAGVHAAWWNDVQGGELDWVPTMIGPRIEYVDQLLVQILPVFLDHFGDALPSGGRELYEQFAGSYLKINQTLAARSPWTLVHQDFRVENLLFGPEGSGEVYVLDWQGIGRGPAAYDLAYNLSGSMESRLRRDHETELLDAYLAALHAAGVLDYDMEQLRADYAMAMLQGGLATAMVTGGSTDLSNDRAVQLITTMAQRHVQGALDHDGPRLLAEILGRV